MRVMLDGEWRDLTELGEVAEIVVEAETSEAMAEVDGELDGRVLSGRSRLLLDGCPVLSTETDKQGWRRGTAWIEI